MSHAFFDDRDLALLLAPADWRIVGPGSDGSIRPSGGEHRWRSTHGHAHPHGEVMVVLAGEGGFGLAGAVHAANRGLVALLPPDSQHDCGIPPGVPSRQLWLAWMGGRTLVSLVVGGATWSGRSVLTLAGCADPCLLWDDAATRNDPWRLRSALASTLSQVIEGGWQATDSGDEALVAICRHLEDNGGVGHSLASLARLTGVSRAYFARIFLRHTGQTVGSFINRCRAARARSLRALGRTESEIAALLGFSSPQSWARWRRLHATSRLLSRS
jgi:AraC-like DNA-binding protein